MSRELSTSISNLLSATEVKPFFAVDLLFDVTPVYAWTGVGDITVDGRVYSGTGQLLEISEVHETAEIEAKGATITISGVPSDLLSLALSEPYHGRKCKIYLGMSEANRSFLLKEDGGHLLKEDGSRLETTLGNPAALVEIFSGFMDQMVIDEGPETSTIAISVESRLIDLERERIARYTSGYQKSLYPNDLAFDFVNDMQDQEILWGRS